MNSTFSPVLPERPGRNRKPMGVKRVAFGAAAAALFAGGMSVTSVAQAGSDGGSDSGHGSANSNGSSNGNAYGHSNTEDSSNATATADAHAQVDVSANGEDHSNGKNDESGKSHGNGNGHEDGNSNSEHKNHQDGDDHSNGKDHSNGSINGVSGTGGKGHYAVTICHATRSAKHPYVAITVDASSISHLMSAIGNGHGKHSGPVFNPAVNRSGDDWGDIIPPVNNPLTGVVAFPGMNTAYLDWIGRGCTAAVSTSPTASSNANAAASENAGASGSTPANATPAGTVSTGAAPPASGTVPGSVPVNVPAPGQVPSGYPTILGPPVSIALPQPGTVTGSPLPGTVTGGPLPGTVTLPAAVPAGDGSSTRQDGLPVWALLAMALALAVGIGSIAGLATSEESDRFAA